MLYKYQKFLVLNINTINNYYIDYYIDYYIEYYIECDGGSVSACIWVSNVCGCQVCNVRVMIIIYFFKQKKIELNFFHFAKLINYILPVSVFKFV